MTEEIKHHCPACGWSSPLRETKSNVVVNGGCPHCWTELGRYIPVNLKPSKIQRLRHTRVKEETKGWDII